MSYLAVTNFRKYQHYKNRKPPWVKFYVNLLDPLNKLNALPVPTRYLFDRLLLLAAEWDNAIPNDSELLAKLVVMDKRACREGIADLLQGHWLSQTQTPRRASKRARAPASGFAPPETETELTTKPSAVEVTTNGSGSPSATAPGFQLPTELVKAMP